MSKLRIFTKAMIVGGLALGSLAVATPGAQAAGTSGKTNGCYAKWWNTAFAGYCNPATDTGGYQLFGNCNNESDFYSTWRTITKGSIVMPFVQSECTFSVTGAAVYYRG